jgi:phosphatidylglycerol:prolipoprotein diacylglycerol transferase
MFPILQIGPLALHLPGLILLAGIWIGSWLIDNHAPRYRISPAVLSNMVFLSLAAGVVGARLWYAFRYLDVYLEDPLSLLSFNFSTLAPVEGMFTGLVTALIYGQRKRLPLWSTLDALTLGFAAFMIAFSLAHLSSGDAFGSPTDVPWAVELWGAMRHPSQVYELLIGGLIFVVIWRLRDRQLAPGILFNCWVSFFAVSRLFLEAFRGDSVIVLGTLRVTQVISLAILLGAMLGLHILTGEGGISPKRKS